MALEKILVCCIDITCQRKYGGAYLGLRQIEVEALAQGLEGAVAALEGRAAAPLHHLHQQDDAVCMLAAGQKAPDHEHLHPRSRLSTESGGVRACARPGSPKSHAPAPNFHIQHKGRRARSKENGYQQSGGGHWVLRAL